MTLPDPARSTDLTPDRFALPRSDWTRETIEPLFDAPLLELVFAAQQTHRTYFQPGNLELATLLSIKTGGCPEDCAYCPQSVHHDVDLAPEKLMDRERVLSQAKAAKEIGASRFCMGAAWRSPRDRDVTAVAELVTEVAALGLETCVTLGMLNGSHARQLADAGLDYYNHNLDTSPEHYPNIISTRTYQDRLDTLQNVREAGIKLCTGGIIGLGEDEGDRASLLAQLASLDPHPESVPINTLVRVAGTPLADEAPIDELDLVRMIAVARLVLPRTTLRLSAGRTDLSAAAHGLCFLAGANSVFYGDELLTTKNPEKNEDYALFAALGLSQARA